MFGIRCIQKVIAVVSFLVIWKNLQNSRRFVHVENQTSIDSTMSAIFIQSDIGRVYIDFWVEERTVNQTA